MIQRIQSIYLLLAAILVTVALCLPVGHFMSADGSVTYPLVPLGIKTSDGFLSTWGLFGILLLASVIVLCAIFLFRNRILQMRVAVFSSVLLGGYYVAIFFFVRVLEEKLDMDFQTAWALFLPVAGILFELLACRGILHDEKMVKAADRLR